MPSKINNLSVSSIFILQIFQTQLNLGKFVKSGQISYLLNFLRKVIQKRNLVYKLVNLWTDLPQILLKVNLGLLILLSNQHTNQRRCSYLKQIDCLKGANIIEINGNLRLMNTLRKCFKKWLKFRKLRKKTVFEKITHPIVMYQATKKNEIIIIISI